MKLFKCLFLVFALFFFAACDNGVKRVVPVDGNGEESVSDEDAADDEDVSDSSVDPSAPDSDTTETSDDSGDSGETADEDAAEISGDADSADSSDDSDSETPDDGDTAENKYCSAVFDGENSKIEVAHNDLLNLNSEAWTIEAWIKQAKEDVADEVPIVAKKGGTNRVSYTYFLSGYYTATTGGWPQQQQTTTAMKGSAYYTMGGEISAEATGVENSGEWTHIALVQNFSSSILTKKPSVTLYINGKSTKSAESNVSSNMTPSIATSAEALLIGSTGTKSFKGLIDSIRISNTAKYSGKEINPQKLSVENDTVALWDFSGNANDSSANNLNGADSGVTYSTDCIQ